VGRISGVEVTAGVGALVAQVAELVNVQSVFLGRAAAVEPFQIHLYADVAPLLHRHIILSKINKRPQEFGEKSRIAAARSFS